MTQTNNDRVVWLLMLGVAVIGSNSLALSPILNDVAADLAATPVEVARANAAHGGATALSALGLGHLVDRLGARPVLVRGLLVMAGAMLASAAAPHWAALAAAQALAGAAAGVALPATYALATATAPEGREARVLGRVLTGWSVSMVAGVPLSALVAGAASWRASYLALAAPLALAAWLLSRQSLPETEAALRPTDGGLAGVLRRPGVVPLLAVCLLFMTAFYGTYAYLGDHARRLLGLSAAQAGLVVLAYGAGFGLASLGDRAVDRIGAKRLFPGVLAAAALVYAALVPATAAFATLLALAAAWGFANHFGLNILVLRLTAACPDRRGAVLALNSATSYAGAFLGAGLFGAVYERAGFTPLALAASACAGLAALIAAATLRPVAADSLSERMPLAADG